MGKFSVVAGVLAGILIGSIVTVITYLGSILAGLPFLPFDLFAFVIRILPGAFIHTSIDLMVKVITTLQVGPLSQTAKVAEALIALLQFIVLSALWGAVVGGFARRQAPDTGQAPDRLRLIAMLSAAISLAITLLAYAVIGFPPAGIVPSIIWLVVIFGLWGLLLGWILRPVPRMSTEISVNRSRRYFLYLSSSAIVSLIAATAGIIEVIRARQPEAEAASAPSSPASSLKPTPVPKIPTPGNSPSQPTLQARITPAPGTRPELTDNKSFYRIDINLLPPVVDATKWKLQIGGLVSNPISLTLDEIRARPAVSQYVTLSCVSNMLGGELISTALFTGTRLKDLLDEVGLQPGAQELYIEAADGFYESVYVTDMQDERTLLVYEMNGQPLPVEHGFPLRIYIPNRYGMKQPKWITRMTVLDHAGPGYWVDRGWSAQATMQTTSVIDGATARNKVDPATKTLPFGGIAHAGARGISKVEVQVDDGPWVPAQLRTPPLGPLTWVQWRYDWPVKPGGHIIGVRAYDGQGKLQDLQAHSDYPNGATGIYTWAFRA